MSHDVQSSRRAFIAGGIVTAAAGLSACNGGGAVTGLTAVSSGPPLTQSELGEWEKLVGASFQLAGEKATTTVKLVALERQLDASRPLDLARRDPFLAFFETDPRLAPDGNKTYRLSGQSRVPFDLFISNVQEKDGKVKFLAVFN